MYPPWATLEPDPYSEHMHIVGKDWGPGMSFNPWVVPLLYLRRTWGTVNGCECTADVQGDAASAQHLRWAELTEQIIPFFPRPNGNALGDRGRKEFASRQSALSEPWKAIRHPHILRHLPSKTPKSMLINNKAINGGISVQMQKRILLCAISLVGTIREWFNLTGHPLMTFSPMALQKPYVKQEQLLGQRSFSLRNLPCLIPCSETELNWDPCWGAA